MCWKRRERKRLWLNRHLLGGREENYKDLRHPVSDVQDGRIPCFMFPHEHGSPFICCSWSICVLIHLEVTVSLGLAPSRRHIFLNLSCSTNVSITYCVWEDSLFSGRVWVGGGLGEIVRTLNKSIHSGWRWKIFEGIRRGDESRGYIEDVWEDCVNGRGTNQ